VIYDAGSATNPALLLATGASVNQVITPLYSNSVWGAGWYNAGDAAHYADSMINYEGGVDFDLSVGTSGYIWDYLEGWNCSARAYPRSMDISPDGVQVFQYRTTGAYKANYDTKGIWCQDLSFNASPDSLITCSATALALDRDIRDPDNLQVYTDFAYISNIGGVMLYPSDPAVPTTDFFANTNPLNPDSANTDPLPFWRSDAQILYIDGSAAYVPFDWYAATGTPSQVQSGIEAVDWSISDANNLIMLKTCSGSYTPSAVLCGPKTTSANVTMYHEESPFDPVFGPLPDGTYDLDNRYVDAYDFKFTVRIQTGAATYVYLEMPAITIESDAYDIPGQDAIVNRSYSLKGLAGRYYSVGTYYLPPLLMSDSAGAIVAPV